MALEAKDRPQSMQSWLEILSYKSSIPNADTEIARTIPWVSLTILLLLSSLMGYILTAVNAPFSSWAGAVAGAVVGVSMVVLGDVARPRAGAVALALGVAVAGAGAVALVVAGAVAVALAGAGAGAGALAGAGAVAGAVAWAVAGVGASHHLEKSFSKDHTFLILTGTSNLGLGLGWIVHKFFTR